MKRFALLAATVALFGVMVAPAVAAPPQPGVNLTMDCWGAEIDVTLTNNTGQGWRVHHYRVTTPNGDSGYTPTWQFVPAGGTLGSVVSSAGDGVYAVTYWVKTGTGWFSQTGSIWYGCAQTNR